MIYRKRDSHKDPPRKSMIRKAQLYGIPIAAALDNSEWRELDGSPLVAHFNTKWRKE
jgi:hypothetical protein